MGNKRVRAVASLERRIREVASIEVLNSGESVVLLVYALEAPGPVRYEL